MNKKLKKIVSVAAMAGLMVSMVLSFGACSSKKKLIIYNWGDYIGENTISKFQSKFPQYEVVYRTFETNETMYPNLSNGYDVIIPSDYMVCRLIEEDRIQQVDWSKLPNVEKNMDPMFRKVKYCEDQKISDSVLQYAVPYLYCTVGLVYDAKKVSIPEGTTDPKAIWAPLFDEANVNKVGMYDSMRESIGVALNYLGYSINSMDEAQLNEAKELLIKQKANLHPTYGVDNLKDKLASGEVSCAVAWSGDHINTLDRLEELGKSDEIDLKFALPTDSNWSVDMMCVPTNCKNYQGAMDFINFMYDPQVALENCEFVGYSTPNVATRAMLDPEVANNKYYYPDEATFKTLEFYYTSDKIEEKYTEIWNTVKASA